MYIVIEIQNTNGSVSTLTWQYGTLNEAQSKYHTILSAAAISSVPIHTAVILTHEGNLIAHESYYHETEVTE